MSRLIERVLKSFNSKYELGLVEKFIATHSLGIAEGAFNQACENININIRWINRNFDSIFIWLTEKKME